MATINIVTIGQAPRTDVTPELVEILGPAHRIIEHGALDLLDADGIAALAPQPGETEFTSRLRDGGSAVFSHDAAIPLVQQAIARGEADGADASLLICSGHFPELEHTRPLFALEALAHSAMRGLLKGYARRRLGVVRPLPSQLGEAEELWAEVAEAGSVTAVAASPYAATVAEIAQAAASLAADSDVIVLDCIGYGGEAQDAARAACLDAGHQVEVTTVRALGAHLLAALLS